MSDPVPPPRIPTWLTATVLALLAAQTGLLWIQGGLIHRQRDDLQGLREDVQFLADSIDQAQGDNQEPEVEGSFLPAHRHGRRVHRGFQRIRMIQEEPQTPPTEEEKARKDLDEARKSAQKAVSDAREVQSKLSIEENIRKAEEKKKLEAAQSTWQKWLWIALGAGLLAFVLRGWIKRKAA